MAFVRRLSMSAAGVVGEQQAGSKPPVRPRHVKWSQGATATCLGSGPHMLLTHFSGASLRGCALEHDEEDTARVEIPAAT